MAKPTVLILCTGNSCRSQMAEGFLRHYAGDRFEARSAGTKPATEVHPLAVQVMAEVGIDITGHRPKHADTFAGQPVAYLITVCGNADQACPRGLAGNGERMHWPFDDPAGFEGTEEEVLAGFRRVRDEIGAKIRAWLASTA
jgi:arsenate reductase (thioredoxin)